MTLPSQIADIPPWVNEQHMLDILKDNIDGFKGIDKFKACLAGGAGENFQSVIVKVEIIAELKDGSKKNVGFMIKTAPQSEQFAMMLAMMGHFPKENLMYAKYLPTFERMFNEVGAEKVTFGPKYYKLKNEPNSDYVLLANLCLEGFKNENRVEGLDRKHTEAVLKKLAQLHAASAVEYENQKGELEPILVKSMFNEQTAGIFTAMMKPTLEIFLKSLKSYEIGAKYIEKAEAIIEVLLNKFIELSQPNPEDFNVICHGDLWSNNIMFQHDDNGNILETRFIDFQLSRYASPVIDLYYFLLTSPKLEIKVANFDDFIKFYHDNLVENLKILNYSKALPTLKQLHMNLLKMNLFGFSTLTNTCAGILLDPSDCGNMEDLLKDGDAAEKMKLLLYTNPRYIKHMETILPWMDSRGLLDV